MGRLTEAQIKRIEKGLYEELLEYGFQAFMVLVKDLVADELSRQKKEIIEELPEKREPLGTKTIPHYTRGWNNALDQAIKTIKKI